MSFKFELHCHTAETSYCASCKASESVALLKEHGYDGVAITNHYYGDWFATRKDEKTWEEKMNAWLNGFRVGKKAGDEIGFSVVLGAEICFDYFPAHFLCYGMDEDFFFEYPELYKMTPGNFLKLANKKGFFVSQAHPLRSGCGELTDPTLVHGMEVFNPNGECFNDIVFNIAKQYNLIATVGSDFHNPNQVAKTAVLLPKLVKDSKELAKLLRKNKIDGYVLNADNIPDIFKNDKRFICE